MDPNQLARFSRTIPDGDQLERLVCRDCGFIHYENPKIVVGAVITHGDRYLLCRRAIEPRVGFWTMPAGFMEQQESTAAGAIRESMEEANVDIEVDALLAVYSIPKLSQVQMFYRATLRREEYSPGPESLEVAMFQWDEIPWDDLAFPTVRWALQHHREVAGRTDFAPFETPDEFLAR